MDKVAIFAAFRGGARMAEKEPYNPFYLLLMVFGVLFTVTALAYAIIPVLEEKATAAGSPPPPDGFRDTLRTDGWQWLLWELLAVVVAGLLSMGLDRLRRLQKDRAAAKIAAAKETTAPPTPQE
jgi:hypothetical protein